MTWEGPHASLDESVRKQIAIVNSFSKRYAMTGWRLGFMISSPEFIDKASETAFNVRSSLNSAVQYAGASTLESDQRQVGKMIAEYASRRDIMAGYLKRVNIGFTLPHGRFEVSPDFSSLGMIFRARDGDGERNRSSGGSGL